MNKNKHRTGQLLNFAQDSYLERTSRPVYAVFFLLPFIIFYEVGTILIRTDVLSQYWQGRVAAFSLLQSVLEWIGFSSKFAWVATPLAVVVILISLQVSSRKRWNFRLGDVPPMTIECILLAVPLIVLSLVFNMPAEPKDHLAKFDSTRRCTTAGTCHDKVLVICSSAEPDSRAAGADNSGGETKRPYLMADIVTSIGAGIYEELVFRLILICLLMILFQDVMQLERGSSIVWSILVSAALFSAYHHIDFLSGRLNPRDPFSLTKFAFRAIAGVYFAVVFAIRGFGITAGAHAFYDIIATVLNAAFYEP